MKKVRILLSSLLLPTIVGLKSVEGQQDSSGLENARARARVKGASSWRDPSAAVTETTTQEIPETDGRNNNQRYLVQNCVVDVSSSMSIVSQVSTTDDEDEEDARRLTTNGGPRKTGGSSTCTVEVVTTSTASSSSTVFAPPLSPAVEDSFLDQDRDTTTKTTDQERKRTKVPTTKTMMMGMKEKGPKSKGPTCIPDASLCTGCIDNFPNLEGNVTAGGQIFICDNTNITFPQPLTFTRNTTISCCNNCAVGLESTCVLVRGAMGIVMFSDDFDGPLRVGFELQRMVLDGNGFTGTGAGAVRLTDVDFSLTDSAVQNFQTPNTVIDVAGGSMTAINSVIQYISSPKGAVYLENSNGFFQSTVFSNNEATDPDSGGAFTVDTDGGTATVTFVDSKFQMNQATNMDYQDIFVRTASATVTCNNATICNSNTNEVFINGTMGFTNQCPVVQPTC